MLYIIEGANYVGKTSTLDILKKKKSFIHFCHPRFNDSQHYSFQYNVANTMFCRPNVDNATIYIPRDVVYQISHMTCLNYLTSVKDKKVLLDRCFLSEMVYNELYDKQIYHEFINVLKTAFDYKIFLLTVNSDDELKRRIEERLKKDASKTYGIRDESGFVLEPETVEDKMKSQRMIEARYKKFVTEFGLNYIEIDTSDKSKEEVAKMIVENGDIV